MWQTPKSKKETTEKILELLRTNDGAVVRALMRIYERQTQDEQRREDTNKHNDIGFTIHDARLYTRFAKQWVERQWLSERQMEVLRAGMLKYGRQLTEIALEHNPREKMQ